MKPSKYNPEISLERMIGKHRVDRLREKRTYAGFVDGYSATSLPLLGGIYLDSLAGLTPMECFSSRGVAIVANALTGRPYGMWRNLLYRATHTAPGASKIRRGFVELAAFETFQIPLYATIITAGQFIVGGSVEWDKVRDGALALALYAPVLAPAFGYWMNIHREFFGLETPHQAAKSAQEQ